MQYQALVLKRFLDVDQLRRVAVSLLLTTLAPGFVSYFVTVKQHYACVRAVQRRLTDAAGGTIRLPVGANVRCSGAHRLRTSRLANCRVTTPVSGEVRRRQSFRPYRYYARRASQSPVAEGRLILAMIFWASSLKSVRASETAAAWLPKAPSAVVSLKIGFRFSCAIGTRLR